MLFLWRLALILALAFPLAGQPGRSAAADSFFEGLEGNWQGSGFIRTTNNGEEESIRCRLINAIASGGLRLRVNGNCAVAGFLLPVTGSIIAEQQSAYSATIFRNLAGVDVQGFSGKRRGSTLQLRYVGLDVTTRQKIDASMTIRKRKGKFDISLRSVDPDTRKAFDVGTIRFQPR